MMEMTGYDHTNNRGFKKLFFETKKDGGLTKNAELAQTLQKDDWVEVTMDDSSYKNVQTIRKIAEPAGGAAAAASGPAPSSGGGGGNDRMSKAEWALKDAKKELSMARHKAIEASAIIAGGKGISKAVVDSIEKLAPRLTAYILTGDFAGEVVEPTLPKKETPADKEPGDEQGTDTGAAAGAPGPSPEDDDIPF
jgi:hypothetical protein